MLDKPSVAHLTEFMRDSLLLYCEFSGKVSCRENRISGLIEYIEHVSRCEISAFTGRF